MVFLQDARSFVRCLAGAEESLAAEPVTACCFDHIVMNLPASAVEFLDALSGAFSSELWRNRPLPLVHCYAFLRDDETEAALRARVEAALGGDAGQEWGVVTVRDVAPHKTMVCVSFRVGDAVGRQEPEFVAAHDGGEASSKRPKLGNDTAQLI